MPSLPKSEKIKRHIKRHQVSYSIGATLIFAGITYLIMRGNIPQRGMGGVTAQRAVANTASFIFRSPQTVNVTTVIAREGRGHPGWPVQNIETGQVFLSQKQAADMFEINQGILSGHLKGKFPDANGLHFNRVNLVPTQSQ